MAHSWSSLNRKIVDCERCSRLRDHCRHIARTKRRAYQDWEYWARPVPNFGASPAPLLIAGLAPAAHGANRTGRMFTGDRSGEWLFRALHSEGFSNQATCHSAEDGLRLIDCAITAVCHCAPPDNKPSAKEVAHCREWFEATITIVDAQVLLALGQIAWKSLVDYALHRHWLEGKRPAFGHGVQIRLPEQRWLLASYHPSQQNTFTGRLTQPMFHSVFRTARRLIENR